MSKKVKIENNLLVIEDSVNVGVLRSVFSLKEMSGCQIDKTEAGKYVLVIFLKFGAYPIEFDRLEDCEDIYNKLITIL